MAQRAQVLTICDLQPDETPGSETLAFRVDGAAYEIDLYEEHSSELRQAVEPFAHAGRRIGRGVRTVLRRSSSQHGTSVADVDATAVRIWARENQIKVSDPGRLSADIIPGYKAAGF